MIKLFHTATMIGHTNDGQLRQNLENQKDRGIDISEYLTVILFNLNW